MATANTMSMVDTARMLAPLVITPTLGMAISAAPPVFAVGALAALGGYAEARLMVEFMTHSPGLVPVQLAPNLVLDRSGGRLGSDRTRAQNGDIAAGMEAGGSTIVRGGNRGAEEYIPGPGGARKGSAYPDVTAVGPDGKIVRVNTVDTRADGVTPTTREQNNADKIRRLRPDDELILIPKER